MINWSFEFCNPNIFFINWLDQYWKHFWITKFKRPIENKIIQRYLKKNKGEKNVHQ